MISKSLVQRVWLTSNQQVVKFMLKNG